MYYRLHQVTLYWKYVLKNSYVQEACVINSLDVGPWTYTMLHLLFEYTLAGIGNGIYLPGTIFE